MRETILIERKDLAKVAKKIEKKLKDIRSQTNLEIELNCSEIFITGTQINDYLIKTFKSEELAQSVLIMSRPYIEKRGINIVEKDGITLYFKGELMKEVKKQLEKKEKLSEQNLEKRALAITISALKYPTTINKKTATIKIIIPFFIWYPPL